MASNSTRILGTSIFTPCTRQRVWLAQHIYKVHNPEFKPAYPEWVIDKVEQYWVEADKKDEHSASGLVAVLYRAKQEDEHCSPTLVFRGTDFDDFRDLGFYFDITINISVFGKSIPLNYSMTKVYNPSHKDDPENIPMFAEQENLQAAIDEGYEAIELINEAGEITVYGNATPVTMIAGILGKEEGDWTTNVKQGLGMSTNQYENAIKFGIIIADKILAEKKALFVTGHSLGGGLASAVATVIAKKNPDLRLNTVTFNAAGVHPNTIKPAVPGDAVIRVFSVKDEVLTTVQSHTDNILALPAIFRWSDRSMPEALGNIMEFKGVCPPGYSKKIGVAEGEELPTLFPLTKQTLIKSIRFGGSTSETLPPIPVYTRLLEVDAVFNNAPTVLDFIEDIYDYYEANYLEPAREWASDNTSWYKNEWVQMQMRASEVARAEIEPEVTAFMEIMGKCADYHGMDFVIAAFEKEYNKRNFDSITRYA